MRVAVDISLYPLADDFIPPIRDVVERLNARSDVTVETNALSTQIFGDFETVMQILTEEIRTTFEQLPKGVFTIRILNAAGER